jgi:hypothetical protein
MNTSNGSARRSTGAALIVGTVLAGAATAAGLALAGVASAAPTGGSNANDTIARLTGQGYSVQINYDGGASDVPMSQCIVTGLHGTMPGVAPGQPLPAGQYTTAYVDVSCPNNV